MVTALASAHIEVLTFLMVVGVALAGACRTTPRNDGVSFFQIMHQLPVSKKSRGRGDVNHAGQTRRQQAQRARSSHV